MSTLSEHLPLQGLLQENLTLNGVELHLSLKSCTWYSCCLCKESPEPEAKPQGPRPGLPCFSGQMS